MGANLPCCHSDTSSVSAEFPVEQLDFIEDSFTAVESDEKPDVDEPQELVISQRRASRNMTYKLVNSAKVTDGDYHCGTTMETVQRCSVRASRVSQQKMSSQATAGSSSEEQKALDLAMQEMMTEVEFLVDQAYDVLPAEMILNEIEQMIGWNRFANEVMTTDLFERMCRKLDFFYNVGVSCCAQDDSWMEVYNKEGKQTIHGQIDPQDSRTVFYRVIAEIPTSLRNVMAVAHELELFTSWNQLIQREPDVIGRRTAHYVVLNYQISAVGGMYKADVLNEIRRFSDTNGGLLAEYICSVPGDHPSYRDPAKGYKRMQTILKNIVVACGNNHTVLIQAGKLKLPFSISQWQAKIIGQVAGKFVVGGLVSNSLRAEAANNPWEKLVKEDKYGIYQRLDACTACEASQKRAPQDKEKGLTKAEMAKITEEIERTFGGRRFARESTRQRYTPKDG